MLVCGSVAWFHLILCFSWLVLWLLRLSSMYPPLGLSRGEAFPSLRIRFCSGPKRRLSEDLSTLSNATLLLVLLPQNGSGKDSIPSTLSTWTHSALPSLPAASQLIPVWHFWDAPNPTPTVTTSTRTPAHQHINLSTGNESGIIHLRKFDGGGDKRLSFILSKTRKVHLTKIERKSTSVSKKNRTIPIKPTHESCNKL